MLLDLTLEVTPKMKKDARENEKGRFRGLLPAMTAGFFTSRKAGFASWSFCYPAL